MSFKKVCLVLFIISYGQLKSASAQSNCGLWDGNDLPLNEVEYFSFSSSASAITSDKGRCTNKFLIKNYLILELRNYSFVCLGSRNQLQCTSETEGVDLCKDYAVDNVKCKNLKYKTDEIPSWECDFKFKVPNVKAHKFTVKYTMHTFSKGGLTEFCYVKDTQYLEYSLVQIASTNNPNNSNNSNSSKSETTFDWTWVIVIGSILGIVGILVALGMSTGKGRTMFSSSKA